MQKKLDYRLIICGSVMFSLCWYIKMCYLSQERRKCGSLLGIVCPTFCHYSVSTIKQMITFITANVLQNSLLEQHTLYEYDQS